MNSIWHETVSIPTRNHLCGDKKTEVAIIGAGMAGILTAFFLSRCGKEVIILEADRIASGQTQNTTAKITSQHGLIYGNMVNSIGIDTAKLYAKANEQALEFYKKMIESRHIQCHYEELPSYIYSRKNSEVLKYEAATARALGISADYVSDTELPFPVTGAVRFRNQAQFHPLEFLQALSSTLTIYEHTSVQAIKGNQLITNHGIVTAEKIIFACHYPFVNIPGFYFARMYQERSYVLALQNTKTLHGMYYGIEQNGLSFRSCGNTLLLGGGSHRCGKHPTHSSYQQLRQAAHKYLPDAIETASWSAQDCITPDHIPYIGQFSSLTPHWFVATGFQKWGMTTSMIAAKLLTDMIVGNRNPYEKIFSPQRIHFTASVQKELSHAIQSAKGLTLGVLPGAVRCPHMGCQMTWNPDEASWDCPCHGSRFDSNGSLINGPAQEDISFID